MPSTPGEVVGGLSLLGRGASFLLRRPRLFWLGALPPLVTSVVFVVGLVVLVDHLGALTAVLTPFAADWSAGPALTARVVVGTLLVGGTVLLKDLQARRGLAFVFVSHDLAVVRWFCSRVAVMYLGRIVEQGPVAEVFARPRHPYTRMLRDASPVPDPTRRGVLHKCLS